ncbi:hypothetical protein OUZ56_007502 [Daphnia magna]|uniref:Uncharacterized protein n=1 Tax=Daphnia magna TaxID=35525 RepID=A0ABR0AAG4_9CRUS|nr:hypothetical protein OUZ56_007502 [Daphnia magna]
MAAVIKRYALTSLHNLQLVRTLKRSEWESVRVCAAISPRPQQQQLVALTIVFCHLNRNHYSRLEDNVLSFPI